MEYTCNLSPREFRRLQTYWFWSIVSREEAVAMGMLDVNPTLAILPLSYQCSCRSKSSHVNIERYEYTSEQDIQLLCKMVLCGSCCPSQRETDDDDEWKPKVCHYTEKRLINLKCLPEKSKYGWNFATGRMGTYYIHIAIALNRYQSVKRALQLNQYIPEVGANTSQVFSLTIHHKLSFLQTGVNQNRYDILELVLNRSKKTFGIDILLCACADSVAKNDAIMCGMFVRVFESLYSYQQRKAFINILKEILNHKAYACAEVVIQSLQQILAGKYLSITEIKEDELTKDIVLLSLLIKGEVVSSLRWLTKAVDNDDLELASHIFPISNLQKENILMLLTKATLKRSTSMIDIIASTIVMKSAQNLYNPLTDHVSSNPRYWATALSYTCCDRRMAQAGIPFDPTVLKQNSPLNDVHHLPYNFTDNDRFEIFKLLVDKGFLVHEGPMKQGDESALLRAYDAWNLPIIQYLLAHGANPENDCRIYDIGYNQRFLMECVYYNIDIFREPSSVVNNLINNKRKRHLIHFVLDTDCPLSKSDLVVIRNSTFFQTDKAIQGYFSQPRPLTSYCRQSFRQYCGHRIHVILENIPIPSSLKNFLKLYDELSPLRGTQ